MTNQLILLKLQQRLDKLGSSDYANLEQWMYIEAFNKAQIEWVRRQLEGINQTKTGPESTTTRIDDLQFLITTKPLAPLIDQGIYYSAPFPTDYLQFNRVSCMGSNDCCPSRPFQVFESIEADRDINLADVGKQPDFDWATTFCTVSGSQVNIYTNGQFDIPSATLTYYRIPANIEIAGVANPITGAISGTDVLCEAADNVIEIFVEEAAQILAADIQNYNLSAKLRNDANQNT